MSDWLWRVLWWLSFIVVWIVYCIIVLAIITKSETLTIVGILSLVALIIVAIFNYRYEFAER